MNKKSIELKNLAQKYCQQLSEHEVLNKYWCYLSLVLKGSVARGNADQFSDIDFVFYCSGELRTKIIQEYYSKGLIDRTDGIFMPLPDWIGHYHFETFETLKSYYREKNYSQIWESVNAIPLHDPSNQYTDLLQIRSEKFRIDEEDIKNKYFELQLTLDWLRHPLKRGEEIAVLLHCTKIIRLICQLGYLLDSLPFPHDKWLFTYIDDTQLGRENKQMILDYAKRILNNDQIELHKELHQYPQYAIADNLVKKLMESISNQFGEHKWIAEWYLYV
ncbi:nucleotidyltransferase domain-containing protein [Vallitalea okinawensis]|uniref:nucleotidyltransferase domain-containing protein n=1 Tax=Vallitalea okinawensis TaxID=2078660 RepID=UPI000CFBF11C|nr:nucleotidyltransferase domain-containing protein [Vallitalea okinawensis]